MLSTWFHFDRAAGCDRDYRHPCGNPLSVFARARKNARKASCQSNLKQIATAASMYIQDWDERTLERTLWVANATTHPWAPYIKNAQVWRCPSRPPGTWSYSYPCDQHNRALSQFEWPSDYIITFDFDCDWPPPQPFQLHL